MICFIILNIFKFVNNYFFKIVNINHQIQNH